ncbi:hypothetical protein L204_102361 [Cryptococcus depauperatus]|nr:specific RNA polymerase II transcription factor [Cryptococcus depauperatus CBS 7855]
MHQHNPSDGMPQQPHYNHSNPWAHTAICCDNYHGESTSMAHLAAQVGSPQQVNAHDPATCGYDCPFDTYCCSGDYCCDKHGSCHDGEECCTNPRCEEAQVVDGNARGTYENVPMSGEDSMKSLQEWAGTAECSAIQQLIECCNQPDCNIPVCPADPSVIHPATVDPLTAIMATLETQGQPIATHSNSLTPSAVEASHTCHWGNCHLVFSSMPDLLAHVASDHLCVSNLTQRPVSLLQQAQSVQAHLLPIPSATPRQGLVPPPSMSGNMPPSASLQLASAASNEALSSCMWDDCFPLSNIPTSVTNMLHQQSQQTGMFHRNAQQYHKHNNAAGEPFSPGTIFRHVLEEHLGIPPEIIGWPNESELQNQTLQPNHHHHHIDPQQVQLSHSGNCNHVHPHPQPVPRPVQHHYTHSLSQGQLPLPTPPSTVNTESASSPPIAAPVQPIPPAKSLTCLWPGCTIHTPFLNTASLMDHLSEVHIPKGRDCYTCHWDGCGGESGRTFKSRQKVLRHLQSHTGHKPFVCGVCDQAFSEAAPLTAHMRRHAQEKPFKCEYPGCGKTFAISSSLTIHMRTHNGEKPFVCPYCQKGFVEASNLTKHIRTHTGERPFACAHPGCGKKFSRPDQLKRHMSVHDKAPGVKRRGSGSTSR